MPAARKYDQSVGNRPKSYDHNSATRYDESSARNSWHKTKSLEWHHLKPVYLPPYSPDFNPIERFWQHLKSHYLAGYLTRSGQELGDKVYNSIRDLLGLPEIIRSVCRTHSP
jgi:transposase